MAGEETQGDDALSSASETPERIAQRKADREGWVPIDRAERMASNAKIEAREAAEKRIADLEERVAATTTTAQPQRKYTRAELQSFVDAGQITQDVANSTWDNQLEAKVLRAAEQRVDQKLSAHSTTSSVQSQIDRYKQFIPDVNDKQSDGYAKVTAAFNDLVDLGYARNGADGRKTELLALREVFGPAAQLQQSRTELQTHQESGARGGSDDGAGDTTEDGWPKDMSAKQRSYYETELQKPKGLYKSKADIIAMHERVKKRRAKRG
jgi:hypothetical protein